MIIKVCEEFLMKPGEEGFYNTKLNQYPYGAGLANSLDQMEMFVLPTKGMDFRVTLLPDGKTMWVWVNDRVLAAYENEKRIEKMKKDIRLVPFMIVGLIIFSVYISLYSATEAVNRGLFSFGAAFGTTMMICAVLIAIFIAWFLSFSRKK